MKTKRKRGISQESRKIPFIVKVIVANVLVLVTVGILVYRASDTLETLQKFLFFASFLLVMASCGLAFANSSDPRAVIARREHTKPVLRYIPTNQYEPDILCKRTPLQRLYEGLRIALYTFPAAVIFLIIWILSGYLV